MTTNSVHLTGHTHSLPKVLRTLYSVHHTTSSRLLTPYLETSNEASPFSIKFHSYPVTFCLVRPTFLHLCRLKFIFHPTGIPYSSLFCMTYLWEEVVNIGTSIPIPPCYSSLSFLLVNIGTSIPIPPWYSRKTFLLQNYPLI